MKKPMPIHQCVLFKCTSKKKLAECLQVSMADLKSIPEWATYRTWAEEKPHGGTRTIYAPSDKLKTVQRRIKHLLERIQKPDWVYSGTKGKCHVDNAFAHQGNEYFVLSDIASFYENCGREAVYQFFHNDLRTSPDVAKLLADITTCKNDEGKSVIPAGSPCSQLLAYHAYRKMFDEFHACAESYGCKISLYVDDITISSQNPITNPKSMMKRFAKIASAYGHSLKWEKTRYYGRDRYKVVTGVALSGSGTPTIPNTLAKNVKQGFDSILAGNESEYTSTKGRIAAARQINPGAFPEIERIIERTVTQ